MSDEEDETMIVWQDVLDEINAGRRSGLVCPSCKKGQLQIEESTAQEGWAPPERLDRVIAGVLARGGEETGEPFEAHIDGREERWTGMLEELGVLLDPASQ